MFRCVSLNRSLDLTFAFVARASAQVCGAELLGVRLERGVWREQGAAMAPFRAATIRLLDRIVDEGPAGWTRALVDGNSLARGEKGCVGTCQQQARILREAVRSRQWAESEGMACVPSGTVLGERDS
jgi:hypothetical protein